jgi:uncharacterized membrane protein HdeD (DUF308 family)
MPTPLSTTIPEPARETLERNWKWIVAGGVLALVLGTIAILVPPVASVTTSILLGWLLVFAAVFVSASAFQEREFWPIAVRILLAALYLVAGIFLLVAPLTGTITLTFVLVAWLWVDGAFRIVGAIMHRGAPGRGWLAAGGVLSILLGVLIWVDFPSSAAWAIGLLVGVNLLFWGINLIVLGFAGRELAEGHVVRLEPRHA